MIQGLVALSSLEKIFDVSSCGHFGNRIDAVAILCCSSRVSYEIMVESSNHEANVR